MKTQVVDFRQTKMLQTNHDGLQERNNQHMEMWEANHEECIKMTSRTKHHNSIVYEKAPSLRFTLNSQASIGFVDNV